MPVRINQPVVPAKPKPTSSATRFVKGAQVRKDGYKRSATPNVNPAQPKTERKAIRQVFAKSKSGHVPKGEGVSGIIIKMLLENKWTNEEITAAIVKKHGQETGEIWHNRIAIFRCDINAGRRQAKQVAALKVKLPLVRFQRINGQLIPISGADTRSKKTGLPGGVKNAIRKPIPKQAAAFPRPKVPVKK